MNADYVAEYESMEKGHWWWQARRDIVLNILHDLLAQRPPREGAPTLLDIGCGAGVNLASFRESFDCVGVEPDPVLVEKARANSQVPVHQGTLPSGLPPLDTRFDYVVLLDVLEHIDDDLAALDAAASQMKPDGRMVINVPALPWMWSVHDEVNQHKRRYLAGGLRELIRGAGLKTSLIRYWGSFPVPLAFLERQSKRLLGKEQSYRVPIPSPRVNSLCRQLLRTEFSLTKSLGLPFGLSLIAVVHKP